MNFTVETISVGTVFKLYKNFYIKTDKKLDEYGRICCCNLKTGVLETILSTEPVSIAYIFTKSAEDNSLQIRESVTPTTKRSLIEIAEGLRERRLKDE